MGAGEPATGVPGAVATLRPLVTGWVAVGDEAGVAAGAL